MMGRVTKDRLVMADGNTCVSFVLAGTRQPEALRRQASRGKQQLVEAFYSRDNSQMIAKCTHTSFREPTRRPTITESTCFSL